MAVEYTKIREKHLQNCLSLWTKSMAEGYENPQLLVNVVDQVDGFSGFVVEVDYEFAGFCAGYVGTLSNTVSLPYKQISSCCSIDLEPLQMVSYLSILCVTEEHQKNGYATSLFSQLLRDMKTYGYPLVTEVWLRESTDGLDVVSKFDFKSVYQSDNYWEFSTSGCGGCPECGSSPCKCPGTLLINLHENT